MTGVLPHYKSGPANKQVAGLIFGGQFVMPNTQGYATTDLTVKLATATSPALCQYAIGVAGNDANVVSTQTGAANAYGQPAIDISVLTDYVAVYYGGVDIACWYSGQAYEGQLLEISNAGANYAGTVVAWAGPQGSSFSQYIGDPGSIVARCTQPGGVSSAMLTQQIGGGAGGGGLSSSFLGRARILV
jgi:hypothetical protein